MGAGVGRGRRALRAGPDRRTAATPCGHGRRVQRGGAVGAAPVADAHHAHSARPGSRPPRRPRDGS
ncbi:hypothetical protein EJC51_42320 [Streptomyces aquilus]|uniref:Uncharacterized protein n=1 Tax=Streptomyces aquilus TaxID=2548456 RepID=A0A3Q9C4Z4_9ACTN|nr:hypothetical protein EJC51_42320 [Streptomyces aquilus]